MNDYSGNPVVAIPLFKKQPDKYEKASLRQCLIVLFRYRIVFFVPDDLDIDAYLIICEEENKEVHIIRFDSSFFKSVDGYNKLLLNLHFYNSFRSHDYILIYQLDAWVFRDELDLWCQTGYDYVGAPWVDMDIYRWFSLKPYPFELKCLHRVLGKGKFLKKVGNGGFSLRKIDSIIKNLKFFNKAAKNWQANEDSFFSHYIGTFNPAFKIPNVNLALKFSFD